jgi:hypothetical protein
MKARPSTTKRKGGPYFMILLVLDLRLGRIRALIYWRKRE